MRLFITLVISLMLIFSNLSHSAEPAKVVVATKKQAIEIAERNIPGKVLKITEQADSYIVRILKPKGRVIDIVISKKDGQIKKD